MQEMLIDSIRVSLMNYQRVVILKERETDRYLPIRIGSPEADAIALKLQDVSAARPLTHDLLGSVIASLGASIKHIVVCDLENDTFYAKLVLKLADGSESEIDCRPSDAIAVAVRGGQLVQGGGAAEGRRGALVLVAAGGRGVRAAGRRRRDGRAFQGADLR